LKYCLTKKSRTELFGQNLLRAVKFVGDRPINSSVIFQNSNIWFQKSARIANTIIIFPSAPGDRMRSECNFLNLRLLAQQVQSLLGHVFGRKPELGKHLATRCRSTETGHADDDSLVAHVTLPAKAHTGFHGHAGLYLGW
jgi:hypothetical protein